MVAADFAEASVFADIVTADQEWVDLEFQRIVAGLDDPPRVAALHPRPPVPGRAGRGEQGRRPVTGGAGRRVALPSVRSPPSR